MKNIQASMTPERSYHSHKPLYHRLSANHQQIRIVTITLFRFTELKGL